jgi:hypothetical protein
MLNSEFLNKQAAIFATDVRELAPDDTAKQVRIVLSRVTQREPTDDEIDRGIDFIGRMLNEHEMNGELALQKFCLLAMNLNEFLYID